MAERSNKKEYNFSTVTDEIVEEAVKTGFLYSLSINHYEQHSREELLERGYKEIQIDVANKVLARFDTSVGAKLGRCPEELWSLRPCVDCGATVNTRKFNTIPVYGVFLCEKCFHARNAVRICVDCGDTHHDSALREWTVDPLVNRDPRTHEYLCRWCQLLRNIDRDFISKRTPPSDRDHKVLHHEVGLSEHRKLFFD